MKRRTKASKIICCASGLLVLPGHAGASQSSSAQLTNKPPLSRAELALEEENGYCYLRLSVTGEYRGSFQETGALTLYTARDTVQIAMSRLRMRFFTDSTGQQLSADLLYTWDKIAPQLRAPVTAAVVSTNRRPLRYAVDDQRAPLTLKWTAAGSCNPILPSNRP